MDFAASGGVVLAGSEKSGDRSGTGMASWNYRVDAFPVEWSRNLAMAGVFPVGGGSDYRGTDWKGRRLGASGSWHVVPCRNGRAKSSGGNVSVWRSRVAVEGEGTSICPISDSSRSDGSMDGKMKRYKKKGRFVLEAAALIPGVCILLVYLVYFTLYAHDYAVCSHAALEAGTKGIYREGDSGGEMEEKICRDLQKKLNHRLLWVKETEIQVKVNPAQAVIQITGQGDFLKGCSVTVERRINRIRPCTVIRKCRWLTGRKKI